MGFKSSGVQSKFGAPIWRNSTVSVGTTAIQLVAIDPLRREVILIKNSNKNIFMGEDGTVTTATGAIFAGNIGAAFGFDTTDEIFGITTAGPTVDIHVIELVEAAP